MIKPTLRAAAIFGLAGVLAGCAGAGSAPPSGSAAFAPSLSQTQPLFNPIEDTKCTSDHGVSVKPCKVSLSVSNPSVAVTAKGPKGGTFTVDDSKCRKKMIAEVEGAGNDYVAVSGIKAGTCYATFIDKIGGKSVGTALLTIINSV